MNKKVIQLPIGDDDIKNLSAGDVILLSGEMITARDEAHRLLYEAILENGPLPVDLKGQTIYYVGPSETKPGRVIGAAGPTSSYRMDKYAPKLLDMGVRAMIGKGDRNDEVIAAIKRNKAVYFAAIGGAAALISKSIKRQEILCYDFLGTEAVRRLWVEDFFAVVAIDMYGNNIYTKGDGI